MKIWLVKHRRTKKADRQNAKGIKEGRILDYDFKKRDSDLAKRFQAYMPFALKQDSVSNNSISGSAENSNTFSEENSDILKEDRTVELTDEQVIEQRLKNLK